MHTFFCPTRKRITVDCGSEQITKQSHKDECDIHKILNQFKKTGIIQHITSNQSMYVDLPNSQDYQQSLNIILEAQDAFASLPSSVRDAYGNNPENFLRAIGDPDQRETLENLGVFNKKPASSPAPAPAPAPAPSPDAE